MVRQNNLRRIRHSLKLSLMGLAVISGVSTATLVGIERYNHYPGPSVRERISKAMGVLEEAIWPNIMEVVNDGK